MNTMSMVRMAHGGIAQAGKVRNVTPKVEKKTKTSKTLTGRAHKRAQYARFVARQDSGTRDGPNKQQVETKK